MAYATLAQVQGMVPYVTIGAATQPTATQVQQFIADRSSEIDAALASRGLATPVTNATTAGATFLADLARLNAEGAAADVLIAAFVSGVGADSTSSGALRQKAYLARLDSLRKGLGIPVGLPVAEPDQATHDLWTDSQAVGAPGVNAFGEIVPSRPIFAMNRRY